MVLCESLVFNFEPKLHFHVCWLYYFLYGLVIKSSNLGLCLIKPNHLSHQWFSKLMHNLRMFFLSLSMFLSFLLICGSWLFAKHVINAQNFIECLEHCFCILSILVTKIIAVKLLKMLKSIDKEGFQESAFENIVVFDNNVTQRLERFKFWEEDERIEVVEIEI